MLKAASHWRRFIPIEGTANLNIGDFWVCLVDNSRITNEMLGILIDSYPRMSENYRPKSQYHTTVLAKRGLRQLGGETLRDDGSRTSPLAYPTLSLTLEIKKLLPPEGVNWLFCRAQAKEIRNGRMDSEVVILDKDMELVAVSQQLSFIVSRANREGTKSAPGQPENKL